MTPWVSNFAKRTKFFNFPHQNTILVQFSGKSEKKISTQKNFFRITLLIRKRIKGKSVLWQFLCEKNGQKSRDPARRLVNIHFILWLYGSKWAPKVLLNLNSNFSTYFMNYFMRPITKWSTSFILSRKIENDCSAPNELLIYV